MAEAESESVSRGCCCRFFSKPQRAPADMFLLPFRFRVVIRPRRSLKVRSLTHIREARQQQAFFWFVCLWLCVRDDRYAFSWRNQSKGLERREEGVCFRGGVR